jgi:hypothetical protein
MGLGVAILRGHKNRLERPVDGQIAIVPPDRRPSVRIVQSCAFVLDFDSIRQGAEAGGKTCRRAGLLPIFRGHFQPKLFSETGGRATTVGGDKKYCAVRHAHQLAHRQVPLKVESTQNPPLRIGVVVLHKLGRNADSAELIGAKRLHNESALICENLWAEYYDFIQVARLDLERYDLVSF